MPKIQGILAVAALLVAANVAHAGLKIGTTLHPYYSWTRAVAAGTDVEVRSIIPGAIDAGSYQPTPEDVQKLTDLDAIVINDLGHDDFIHQMIRAAGNEGLRIIRVNDGTPLLQIKGGEAPNSHTFISFTNAIQQTYNIERALTELQQRDAERFRANARAYTSRLRQLKARVAAALVEPRVDRVVTVHDGYAYLLQELGIEVAGVVEPVHGLVPSAGELGEVLGLLQREGVEVIFSEERFPAPLLEVLSGDSGAEVYVLSHIASGPYTDARFEEEMTRNGDTLIRALQRR